jgi:hypothetical protein
MLMDSASSVVLKTNAITPCARASRRISVDAISTSAVWEVVPITNEK